MIFHIFNYLYLFFTFVGVVLGEVDLCDSDDDTTENIAAKVTNDARNLYGLGGPMEGLYGHMGGPIGTMGGVMNPMVGHTEPNHSMINPVSGLENSISVERVMEQSMDFDDDEMILPD